MTGAGTVVTTNAGSAPVEAQHNDNECWAGAIATLIAVILQRLPSTIRLTRLASRFRDCEHRCLVFGERDPFARELGEVGPVFGHANVSIAN